MNIKELIEKYEYLNHDCFRRVDTSEVLRDLKQLDEHENSHAEQAPRYVKNILARLRELPLHDREVWLKAIMGEFEQDFSRTKWREGYEQGKVEGLIERDKPIVKPFVADWYEKHKNNIDFEIWHYLHTFSSQKEDEFKKWMNKLGEKQIQTLVNMHQFGYEVEKEKRYFVRLKGVVDNLRLLRHNLPTNTWTIGSEEQCFNVSRAHTRKELEEAGFGDVFNSPLFEVEEVEG